MKCVRCEQEFEQPESGYTNICNACADIIRDEEDAYVAQQIAEGNILARDLEAQEWTEEQFYKNLHGGQE